MTRAAALKLARHLRRLGYSVRVRRRSLRDGPDVYIIDRAVPKWSPEWRRFTWVEGDLEFGPCDAS
jgi:hypothetical protein